MARRLVTLSLLICLSLGHGYCDSAVKARVAILKSGPAVRSLDKLYRQAGYSVSIVTANDLSKLKAPVTSLLVIPPGAVFPPDAREDLSRYLKAGGNLADLSPQAFKYDPKPVDPKPVVDFGNLGGYTVTMPSNGASTIIALPGGKSKGVYLTSTFVWDGDLGVTIPLTKYRGAGRNVICFDAKGDYDIDILRLILEDDAGSHYVAFVDMDRAWRHYAVPMADFVRVGDDKGVQSVDPDKVRSVSLGVGMKVVWKDAKGSVAIGPVALARATQFAGAPTSSVTKWYAQYAAAKAVCPDWIIDPFLGTRKLEAAQLQPVGDQSIASGAYAPSSAYEIPFPVQFRGHEDTELSDALKMTDMRRTPLLQVRAGNRTATVAEIRTFTGGQYDNASFILFGIDNADYAPGTPLGRALIAASDYVTRTPRIVRVVPFTPTADSRASDIGCKVTVFNPGSSSATGTVTVSVADGLMHGVRSIALKPGVCSEIEIGLGEVGEKFPFAGFRWRAELAVGDRRDVMSDTVNMERSLVRAATYAMRVQKAHPDGRYSVYFFTDIYTARMLFAVGNYLRDPAVWKRNADLLTGLRPNDFSDSAFRFCDMIVSRQRPDGGIPIGYAEHSGLIFTADDGSIALGLLQIASWMGDDARAQHYRDAARKYFGFRESLYITAEKSTRLQSQFGKDSPGTREGFYGLGILNSDMLTKGGERWPKPRTEERGIYWVMPVSMGAVCALDLVSRGSADYHKVVLRDATEFVSKDYPISRASHFHVEGLFWLRQAVTDPELRGRLDQKIGQVIPALMGWDDALTYSQGRGALHWLNLAYYRRLVADTPRVRALQLQGVWDLCSDTSCCSVKGIADRFPTTSYGPSAGGYRCASYGSIALMEMLRPGSTLLRGLRNK